jgi:plasmid stability protein
MRGRHVPLSQSPGRDAEKFMLRLPTGLREKIRISAALNRRSMNSEIVVIIEEGLEKEMQAASPQSDLHKETA